DPHDDEPPQGRSRSRCDQREIPADRGGSHLRDDRRDLAGGSRPGAVRAAGRSAGSAGPLVATVAPAAETGANRWHVPCSGRGRMRLPLLPSTEPDPAPTQLLDGIARQRTDAFARELSGHLKEKRSRSGRSVGTQDDAAAVFAQGDAVSEPSKM